MDKKQELLKIIDMALILDLVGYAKLSRAKRKELKKMRDELEQKYWREKQAEILDIIEKYKNLQNETHSTRI